MANYTGEQLSGAGIAIPELIASTQYQFVMVIPTTLNGSGYFTVETVKDADGFYNSTSPTNAIGIYTDFVNTPLIGFITSSYISSIVCTKSTPTAVSYKFSPTVNIAAGSSRLRSTGGIGLQLNSTSGFVFTTKTELQTAVDLWISDRTAALAAYGDINTWIVTAITDMSALFNNKTTFNSDISNWDVSNVTNMNSMFRGTDIFNQDISSWDVENVTQMNSMFALADAFNQNIDSWKVASVTSMQQMFSGALAFNQSLQSWTVSNVTNMESMFTGSTSFNGDIGLWNVSSVENMQFMFSGATAFNKPINDWQVQKVEKMGFMFANASSFQQPLNLWEVNALTSASDFMGATGGSSAITYTGLDTLYNGWAANDGNLLTNLTISFGDSTFTSTGSPGKAILTEPTGLNWTITDGGLV